MPVQRVSALTACSQESHELGAAAPRAEMFACPLYSRNLPLSSQSDFGRRKEKTAFIDSGIFPADPQTDSVVCHFGPWLEPGRENTRISKALKREVLQSPGAFVPTCLLRPRFFPCSTHIRFCCPPHTHTDARTALWL